MPERDPRYLMLRRNAAFAETFDAIWEVSEAIGVSATRVSMTLLSEYGSDTEKIVEAYLRISERRARTSR